MTNLTFLERIESPARYLGGERNVVPPRLGGDARPYRVLLSYPDLYSVGMSTMGLPLLYDALNRRPGVSAERVYAPAQDLEAALRKEGHPLFSLESRTPLKEFDLIGFSLHSELTYTNLLKILDLGGVPLLGEERGDQDPLVMAGGVTVFNPEPVARFIDLFYLGDGEAGFFSAVDDLALWKREGMGRSEQIRRLASRRGFYAPGLVERRRRGSFLVPEGITVSKALLADLEDAPLPERPLVPNGETVFDRLSVEIARGCPQKCRFCQASVLYHPFRIRKPETLLSYIKETVRREGFEEFSLSSLSTADYPGLERLMERLSDYFCPLRVSIGLPSLRPRKVGEFMLDLISRTRKTGFTIVPEAGSERLRRVINKGVDGEEIDAAVDLALRYGWTALKFYFMLGLPTETAEDIEGIRELLAKTWEKVRQKNRRVRLSATLSVFIPKPHTPFQWEGFAGREEILAKQELLGEAFRTRRELQLKFHPYGTSRLEALLSRGDYRNGKVILNAYREGDAFDAWDNLYREDLWEKAWQKSGIDPEPYLAPLDPGEPLPWSFVKTGIKEEYLLQERERSRLPENTPSCPERSCAQCGGCDTPLDRKRLAEAAEFAPPAETAEAKTTDRETRVLVFFSRLFPANYLSNLETSRAMERILRRSGLPILFTQGFHPKVSLSFLFADPLGSLQREDLFEMKLQGLPPEGALELLNRASLPGIRFLRLRPLPPETLRFSRLVKALDFSAPLKDLGEGYAERLPSLRESFGEVESWKADKRRLYVHFRYDPGVPFRPYRFFQELSQDYSAFRVVKERVELIL